MLADLRRPGRVVPIVQQSGLCGFVSRPRAPGAPLIIFPRPKLLGHVVHRLPSLREWQKCIPYTMKGSSFDCRYVTTLVFETATRPKSRSEEHTSELQSLMRISYAVFCLKKNKTQKNIIQNQIVKPK